MDFTVTLETTVITSFHTKSPFTIPMPPLTTTFIPPSSCFNRYYQYSSSPYTAAITSGNQDTLFLSCQPSYWGYLTYSPAMCPGLMETAARSSSLGQYTDICCESGFTWDPRGCASFVQTLTTVSVYSPEPRDGQDHFTTVSSVIAIHDPFTAIWKSEDLSLFPADVVSSRVAFLNTLNSSTNSINTQSLSQSAKVGIGVGAAVGGLIILTVASAWLCKLRRRRRRLPAAARNGATELDGSQPIWKRFFDRKWRAELFQSGQVAELESKQEPAELTGRQSPVELPGSYLYSAPATEVEGIRTGVRDDHEKKLDQQKENHVGSAS